MKTVFLGLALVMGVYTGQAHAQKKDLARIRVGYAAPTVDNVLIAIAQKAGIFEKHGLSADLVGMRGGVQVLQGLMSNSLEFGEGGAAETVTAILSGMEVTIIAGLIPRINYFLVVRPGISEPSDLIGKKIAVASLSGSVIMLTRLALQNLGVSPNRVSFLVAGPPQDRVLAVASGQMDATVVAPEGLPLVTKAGLKLLKDLSELPVPVQLTILSTTKKLIGQRRGLAKAFLAAIADSITFYREREKETIDIIEAFTGVKDRQALKGSYDLHKRLFPEPPYPDREGIQTVINQTAMEIPSAKGALPEAFFDSSLLREIKSR